MAQLVLIPTKFVLLIISQLFQMLQN